MLFYLFLIGAASGSEHRVALVIGNADYSGMKSLSNSLNDSADIASKLRGLGFDIVYRENLRLDQAGTVLQEFEDKLTSDSVALVYFAGHGVQVDGENYLPLVDANIRNEHDVRSQSLSLKQLMAPLDRRETRLNLVFLDACRDNPYQMVSKPRGAVPAGLARYEGPQGSLIVYATAPGRVAQDGIGRNGPFAQSLLENIDTSDLEVNVLLTRVTAAVAKKTNSMQIPFRSGNLQTEFYFKSTLRLDDSSAGKLAESPRNDPDVELWKEVSQSELPDDYQYYLDTFPQGQYAATAKLRFSRLQRKAAKERQTDRIEVPEWTTDRALGLLNNLAATKPKGKLGQAEALQFLTSQGYSVSGMDLSGLDLSGVSLSSLNAEDSQMSMASLSNSDCTRCRLSRARMLATRAESTDFSDANLTGIQAAFGQFKGSIFRRANLRNSNWGLADLRNANFKDADLTGANFDFADLRGADLTGAKLQHAFLGGADLRGAKFDRAELGNTDIVSAVYDPGSPFDGSNLLLCETPPGTKYFRYGAWELIPNTTWEGGYEHKKLREWQLDLPGKLAVTHNSCDIRRGVIWDVESKNAPVWRDYEIGSEYLNAEEIFRFDHALLKTSGWKAELLQLLANIEPVIRQRFAAILSPTVKTPKRIDTLAAKLRDAVNKVSLQAPLHLNEDSTLLYLLKTSPGEEAKFQYPLTWGNLADIRYRREVDFRNKKPRRPQDSYPDAWGDFFPVSTHLQDIWKDPIPELFRQWTLARVAKIPMQLNMQLGVRFVEGKAYWYEGGMEAAQHNDPSAVKELALTLFDIMTIETPLPGHTGLMAFTKPLKETIPIGAIPADSNYGAADVKLDIRKVRLYKNFVVWEVTPVEAILAK